MSVLNLFSKRQKQLRGEVPDVYQYSDIPEKLRAQIIHIINDSFGTDRYECYNAEYLFQKIQDGLCREYGRFRLIRDINENRSAVCQFLYTCKVHEEVLDVIELTFQVINNELRHPYYHLSVDNVQCTPDDAIAELNYRFKENGVGYQFESNTIIKIDSQFIHHETVKPVLNLLSWEKRFNGANEEFLKAHEHYRMKRYKECLVDCLKSFESVMKAICSKQKWTFNQGDSAKKLIEVCFNKDLIPQFMQAQFTGLRTLLESGVPTVRNKLGGHGQGTENVIVTESLASYALHLTASNILFLSKLEKENFG